MITDTTRPAYRKPRRPLLGKWTPTPGSRVHRGLKRSRNVLGWSMVGLIGFALLVIVASFFVDEPIRRKIEGSMNRKLTGYQVRVPRAHFQLFGLAVTLRDLQVRQDSHPDPAVLIVPELRASVQWTALVHGKLVANFTFEHPNAYLNLRQLRSEIQNDVKVKDEGWQDALQAIYPLKINLLTIHDGTVTYADDDPEHPLRLTQFEMTAGNIRNVKSDPNVLPSEVHAEAVVFGSGRAVLDGLADFMLKPKPGILATFQITDIPLDDLRPVAARSNIVMKGGVMSGSGQTEYTPGERFVHFDELLVRGAHVDFIQGAKPSGTLADSPKLKAIKDSVRTTELRIKHLALVGGTLGTVNKTKHPNYRLYVSNANVTVARWSNQPTDIPATASMTGRFMGVGATRGDGSFQVGEKTQNFNLRVEIDSTPLTKMNDLLRAYGNFDVARGDFTMYTELTAKNNELSGYLKPLFHDVKVYSGAQDKHKNEFKQLYERAVGLAAKLLENQRRDDVATVARVHGRIGEPQTSFFQILGRMLENAFVKAILPGFLRKATKEPGTPPKPGGTDEGDGG